jgi:hypothetical protein
MLQTTITDKQQEILSLLYRFRFLNRKHLQTLLNNTDHTRINRWLKDLTEKQYTGRIFKRSWTQNSQPAVYYLSQNGIRYLRNSKNISNAVLQKYYKDRDRSQAFINRCLFIADLYTASMPEDRQGYTFYTQADFTRGSMMTELKPDLVLKDSSEKQPCYTLYQLFPEGMPRFAVRKRAEQYMEFFSNGDGTGLQAKLIFICHSQSLRMYLDRYVKRLLQDDSIDLNIQVTDYDSARKGSVL